MKHSGNSLCARKVKQMNFVCAQTYVMYAYARANLLLNTNKFFYSSEF